MTVLTSQISYQTQPMAPGIAALQNAMLWLVGASGSIVFFEPSPYEISTLAALIVFFATGLRLRPIFLTPIIRLVLINFGYTISAIQYQLEAANPANIDSVSFTTSASAGTVKVKVVASSTTPR